eukprot:jgi/Ulvmu1/5023/UM021_0040.1
MPLQRLNRIVGTLTPYSEQVDTAAQLHSHSMPTSGPTHRTRGKVTSSNVVLQWCTPSGAHQRTQNHMFPHTYHHAAAQRQALPGPRITSLSIRSATCCSVATAKLRNTERHARCHSGPLCTDPRLI